MLSSGRNREHRPRGPHVTAITRAAVEHAEGIATVHVAAWRRAYDGLLPADVLLALSVEKRTEAWRRQLQDMAVATWVAGTGGTDIDGFVSVGRSRDDDASSLIGELYAIYVHPDSWSTGVGYALFSLATRALAADYVAATLWVLEGNSRACRFYERQGWTRDGARREQAWGAAVLQEARYSVRLATGG
jgi:GNAT superfamily N-acetyltransferase